MKSSNRDAIQKAFTEQASGFESSKMNFTKQEYLDYTIEKMNPTPKDFVLEVAAGTCACGRSIAPHTRFVTCLDMTPAMLEVGKEEAKKNGLSNILFMLGDAAELPFLDNSFDLVFSRLSFHHFPNPKQCFSEMARVLKPGGKLVVIDMEAAEETLRDTEDEIESLRDGSHIRNLSKSEFLEMSQENHLSVITVDCTEIPVSLSAWLALTNTPMEISAEIEKRFKAEITGDYLTGFKPYMKNGEIYFNQRWFMMIGKKD